ncbi:GvpL/GvpF family gas vesicle protein [Streptomyces sp. NPDC101132]|uniref:GvpL/GvpF family gas vesicle protein n=1 Tax=Streptomyces sp. NPDC101132 TaxID=3366110 RepID=UPI00380A2214
MNPDRTLTYVYAVAAPAPGLREAVAALRGVAAAPVEPLEPQDDGPPAAVFLTSQVPEADWGEEPLKARFEDLDWLEDTARSHHRVIEALTGRTTVLPLRMATLYQDRDRALAALGRQQRAFADRLASLAHHREYGVKAYVRTAPEDAESPPTAPPPAPAASPGKAYLRARRAQHHAREDRHRQAALAAERIAATAASYASHRVRHPAQTGPLTRGESGENVLNDAYLVRDDQAGAFRAAVEEAGEGLPGIRIEVTGPWAPYSFATLPLAPDRADPARAAPTRTDPAWTDPPRAAPDRTDSPRPDPGRSAGSPTAHPGP